jgi:hypothetical protein
MSIVKKFLLFALALALGAFAGILPFTGFVITHINLLNAVGVFVYGYLISPVAVVACSAASIVLAKRGKAKIGFRFAVCAVFFFGMFLGLRHIGG